MFFGLRTWINVCKCLIVILVVLEQCRIQFLAVYEAGLFRLDKVIVAAITTTHYSREDILAYRRYDITPPRAVRKAILAYSSGFPVMYVAQSNVNIQDGVWLLPTRQARWE